MRGVIGARTVGRNHLGAKTDCETGKGEWEMSTIGLKITNRNGVSAELEMSGAEAQERMAVITGMFAVLGAQPPVKVSNNVSFQLKGLDGQDSKAIADKVEQTVQKSFDKAKHDVQDEPKANVDQRPKQLPKINEERTLTYSLGEKLQEAIEKKDSDETLSNIRYTPDGRPLYQTAYECPCGDKGIRFNLLSNDYTKCRACDTKLRLRFANPKGLPHTDNDGNFFIADAPLE
jgi:hypothetical protein